MASGKRIVNFKIDLIDKLALDAHVERKGVSKSEYCRLAVLEKLQRDMKRKQNEEQQDSEHDIIMQTLNTMNNHLHSIMNLVNEDSRLHSNMLGGFRRLCQGIVVTNKDNAEQRIMLHSIFPQAEVWSKLAELGVK